MDSNKIGNEYFTKTDDFHRVHANYNSNEIPSIFSVHVLAVTLIIFAVSIMAFYCDVPNANE